MKGDKMVFCKFLAVFCLLTSVVYVHGASAVHSHSVEKERESDGGYRPRDADHYTDAGHNTEFDHEVILGSVKQAEEFDKLSPEESRERLALLLPLMDLNGDKFIDRNELVKWILQSFVKLSHEEAEERMNEADENRDGFVSWQEYLRDGFGVDMEEEIQPDDIGETGMVRLLHEEKAMWAAADTNNDGKLNFEEFSVFVNPEENESMHPFLLNQTLREKDKNQDGIIDLQEYLGDRGAQQDKDWLISEREKFEQELDTNRDGMLSAAEIKDWIIPNNNDIAEEEVDHLFEMCDADRDGLLSYSEVLARSDVFVGSEATAHGEMVGHLGDEL